MTEHDVGAAKASPNRRSLMPIFAVTKAAVESAITVEWRMHFAHDCLSLQYGI